MNAIDNEITKYAELRMITGWVSRGHGVATQYKYRLDISFKPERTYSSFADSSELAFLTPGKNEDKVEYIAFKRRLDADGRFIHSYLYKELDGRIIDGKSIAFLMDDTKDAQQFDFVWSDTIDVF